jgi:hypothetical protein
MSKRWHDITPETGDPKDLPTENTWYCVTRQDYLDTWRLQWRPRSALWCDDEGNIIRDVIAWKDMPEPFDPGKRKPKPARFVHECEMRDGQEPQSIELWSGIDMCFKARHSAWRELIAAMWGKDASKHIGMTNRGTTIPVRVTVEMG